MDLKDKVVVITGASRGLGRAIAETLSEEGCELVVSSRSKERLEGLASKIKVYAVEADVRKESDVVNLAAEAVKKFGRIDIWINNAGIWIPHDLVEDIDWARAHDMMEVNFFGTAYGSKAALRYMKQQKSGMIINILSTSALKGNPKSSAYAASKYAQRGFTDALRDEVRENGITVISVYPGGMKTILFNEQLPEDYDKYMEPTSVARKIVANLKSEKPEEEQLLKRPAQ